MKDPRHVLPRMADHVRELVAPYSHYEPHKVTKGSHSYPTWHRTDNPSLLDQLRELADPANGKIQSDGSNRARPGTRPAAELAALALLATIRAEVYWWLTEGKVDTRDTLESNIRALLGYATTLDDPRPLGASVASWRSRIRVATGWQAPAFRPKAPCPRCDADTTPATGLRVRTDGEVAWCVTCDTRWGADTTPPIEVLKAHCRQAGPTEDEQEEVSA